MSNTLNISNVPPKVDPGVGDTSYIRKSYVFDRKLLLENLINNKKGLGSYCLLSELVHEVKVDALLKITGADTFNGFYLDPTVQGSSVCRKYKLVKTGRKKGKKVKVTTYGRRFSDNVSGICCKIIRLVTDASTTAGLT